MPVIPADLIPDISRTSGLVTHTILVEGEALPSTVDVYAIDVWSELNRVPRAEIIILDGNVSEGKFTASEEEWFIPGNAIAIKLGYQSEEETVFEGIVTGQSVKVRSNGNSMLTVSCADPAIQMTAGLKSRYFYDSTESEIFENIISEYPDLIADVQPTSHSHTELLQFQSTDWDFMLTRADINGLLCNVAAGTISIAPPDFNQEPVETVKYGNNLIEFDAELDGINQFSNVKGMAWDFSKTESAEAEASPTDAVTPGNLTSEEISGAMQNGKQMLRAGMNIAPEVLQSWASAKRMKNELSKVRGRAQLRGLPTIKPGVIVVLEGVGDRFNGKAFVSGAKHSFCKGEWLMDVQFGLSEEWFSEQYEVSEKAAGGMVPAISGLQVGLVTQIQDDPDGNERILVRLPMIDSTEQGVWARLATAGAGDSRGVVIRPEIDDEVIIGFIHEDPNQPVILGSVHSANRPSPITPADDNHEKGWVTRGEIRLLINDDDPSIKIEMPSGKKILIDDAERVLHFEDEHGNSILMSSDGINVESAAEINIKAAGDLNIEGTNINAVANAGFKAEGSASAEISSSGSTSVKGSIVQIN